VPWDSAALRVKDVEDWAALVEREALERVSRVKAENATVLASAHEDAKGFTCKITLLEDELAAELQARGVSKREH
jgi:ketosteroid isomerase-like protein